MSKEARHPRFVDVISNLRLAEDMTSPLHTVAAALDATPQEVLDTLRVSDHKTQTRMFRVGTTVYLRLVVSHGSSTTRRDAYVQQDRAWTMLARGLGLRYEDDPRSLRPDRPFRQIALPNRSLTGCAAMSIMER
jgi:hypothetical protein